MTQTLIHNTKFNMLHTSLTCKDILANTCIVHVISLSLSLGEGCFIHSYFSPRLLLRQFPLIGASATEPCSLSDTVLLPRASKGLCDRSWRLYIVVYCILYISLHFFLEPIFYLPKYSLSEVCFNRDRLLIEFNGLWYSLAARQVFAAIANPDSLSFG